MERKRKPENQGGTPQKKQKTIASTSNKLEEGEVLIPSSDKKVQWIITSNDNNGSTEDKSPEYKGFVRSGTYYRLGNAVYMTTDKEEPFIAEIVRLFEGDEQLCAEVRYVPVY